MNQREKLSAELSRGFSRVPNVVLLAIELLVLLAVLAAAWRERSPMPLVPIADDDTWGYLNPALSWLSGLGLQQTDGREWLYPALLALFLKTTGSFVGIALWQKFLGISSGVLMALTWRCWVSTLPLHRWAHFSISLIGALPLFVQLMNPQSVFFEMSIRPEAVLSFFVYGQFACLMGYYKYRWQTPKALPSMILGAAAIFLSYACLQLKPSWLFACVITSAPVFMGVFGRAPSLGTRLLAPALGIVFSFLVLWLPGAAFLIPDRGSRTVLPSTLFTIHARLIDNSLEAKLAGMSESDPEKAKLRALVTVLENEIPIAEKLPSAFTKLGFDPDYLFYRSSLIPAIYRYTGDDDEKFRAFCISCYRDAAFHDPLGIGAKGAAQFTYFLFPNSQNFYNERVNFARSYVTSAEALSRRRPELHREDVREMYRRYQSDLAGQAGRDFPGMVKSKSGILKNVSRLAPYLEFLYLLTFAASLIWAPLRDLRLSGWAAVSLFSAPLANAVLVSMVHALDNARYRHTFGGFLLFALLAMTVFSSLVIARSLRHEP